MPPGTCICFGHYADCERHTCNSAGRSDLLYGLRELRVFDGHGGKEAAMVENIWDLIQMQLKYLSTEVETH